MNSNSGEYYKGDNTSNHGQYKTSSLAVFAHLETLDKLMQHNFLLKEKQRRVPKKVNQVRFGRNRTGTSVDDGARKLKNWLYQWQSDKLRTGSRV